MRTFKVIVSYPIYVDVTVSDDATPEMVEEMAIDLADGLFSTTTLEPVIQDVTEVDKNGKRID